MKHLKFFALLMFFLFALDASAYLDPGTGSIIIQALIAGFVGAAFVIKIYYKRIKDFFANIFSKKK
ncbi:MAG: hypothetical protein KAT33_03165 [Bacteroidales bacterium]|nr:hypothetical protein [Bacteroidales bacterium]